MEIPGELVPVLINTIGGKSLKLSTEVQQVTSVMPRSYNLPSSRPWPSGCPLPRKRHQDGGTPHAAFTDCVTGTPTLC